MNSSTIFRAYRYQLLPLDRNETKDLYHARTANEIVEQKNALFAETLIMFKNIKHRHSEIIVKIEKRSDDLFILRLAPSRPLTRETPDSLKEKVENWPHIDAILLNAPDEQYLLIQDRVQAFGSTDTVANLIKRGTRSYLDKLGLSLHIEPLFDKTYFWELVEQHKNKITWIEFEFITPNMANISKTLADTLKNLGKETNAVKEELSLSSDPESSLDISPKNSTIQGLVEYTSQGGGDITLKVRGIRKRMHTSKSTKEVYLSGLELTASPEQITKIIKDALK